MTYPSLEKVICILGMHRSGTSFLTGSLQQAGLELGKFSPWNKYNTRGNRENQDIVDLHDALLEANGAAWNLVPEREIEWGDEFVIRQRQVLAEYATLPCWGFKDPRTLLVLEGWKRALPNLQCVGIFRSPLSVAGSLRYRSRLSQEESFALWAEYNQRLIAHYEQRPFPILCFDWEEEELHGKLECVCDALGLARLPREERFFRSELRTQMRPVEIQEFPSHLRRLYEKLQGICL